LVRQVPDVLDVVDGAALRLRAKAVFRKQIVRPGQPLTRVKKHPAA
jgi:hypothetical protein